MKQAKPTTNSVTANDRLIQYPIIGSLIGFFSLNNRFKAAQEELQNSAPHRQETIKNADKRIAESEARIAASDTLIAVSRAHRLEIK